MAEQQKKPRIDLKARLGKKSVPAATGAGSVPPPAGIPKPVGIPAPIFGRKGPKVDASDPYAAIDASRAPKRAEPQAIKVELSEEVVQAQKKGRAKVIVLAAVTALVGGILGYTFGSNRQKADFNQKAVIGAGELATEVDAANAKVEELAEVLKSALGKLSNNKYPDDEVSKLGGINIPFEGANLSGRGIDRFQRDIVTMLVSYTEGASAANKQKERLQSVLGGGKKGIEDFLSQQTNPKVRWGAVVSGGPSGPWATMIAVPEPFLVKADGNKWPEKFKIKEGDRDVELDRYSKGDPTGGNPPPVIPVNPGSQASVCPSDVLIRLRRELRETEEILRGTEEPGNEKQGLIDLGQKLHEKLKQVGGPG